MKISSRSIGWKKSLASLAAPLQSTPAERIVLFSSVRNEYQARCRNEPVVIDPLGRYDWVFLVDRAVQRTHLDIDCGVKTDELGWEYKITCSLDFDITVKDERAALERAVRNFDAEYQSFTGLISSCMQKLVRRFIETGAMHAALDVVECGRGLALATARMPVCFEVTRVTEAAYGDRNWRSHPRRALEQAEVQKDGKLRGNLNDIDREAKVMQAGQPLIELQRELALRKAEFQARFDAITSQAEIDKLKKAADEFGFEAAIAKFDPAAYSLMSGHRERMRESDRRLVEEFNNRLIEIMKNRFF